MRFPLVKELRGVAGVALPLAVATHSLISVWWALPLYAFFVLIAFIGRQRQREILAAPLALLVPVDGVVLAVEQGCRHEYLPGVLATRVRIRQTTAGEYVLHTPIEGKVIERWWPDKFGSGAKNFGFVIEADEGDRCVVDVVEAARPRFKTHRIPAGYRARHGQRCGLVGPAVTVEVYFADSSKTLVKPGDLVQAGLSVLAKLKRHYPGIAAASNGNGHIHMA